MQDVPKCNWVLLSKKCLLYYKCPSTGCLVCIIWDNCRFACSYKKSKICKNSLNQRKTVNEEARRTPTKSVIFVNTRRTNLSSKIGEKWKRQFQSCLSHCFKARLSVKPLIWKWFFTFKQIKLIFTRTVFHLASFWKQDI